MRILVSCGGGVDSTALSLQLLRETTDEIIMMYIYEPEWRLDVPDSVAYVNKEERCFFECVTWLRANVRPVTAMSVHAVHEYQRTDPFGVVRRGFTQKCPIFGGKNLFATYAKYANELNVDQLSVAMTTWDLYGDHHSLYWMPIYQARTNVPIVYPFMDKTHEDSDGLGRFEVQSTLPAELFAKTIQCWTDPPCGICLRCRLNAYYQEHCIGHSREEIASVDDELEYHLSLGKYRSRANPKTYSKLDRTAYFTHPEYAEAIKQGTFCLPSMER